MVNYYNLEEAARLLGMSPEDLRKMADRNEIRAFRDRGNLRFRSQDIEERARQLGRGSDPELQPGDAIRPRPSDSPAPSSKGDGGVFDFELSVDEGEVDLGSLARSDPSSSKKGGSSRKGSKLGPASPPPKSGSDSDVRLVPDGSNVDFVISTDSDVKMVQEPPPPRKSALKRKPGDSHEDSGVRIVPLESDSDVKITPDANDESAVALGSSGPRSSSDSDIRLHEEPSSRRGSSIKGKAEPPVTEEIDLDAELREAGASGRLRGKSSPRLPQAPLPTNSPFELSDPDMAAARQKPVKPGDSSDSSDFDLTPASGKDQSPLEMESDDEVTLGELTGRGSGINLQDPADSGISLEQSSSGDDIELELSLDAGATPKPAAAASKASEDSSSEFELSLDAGNTPAPKGKAAPPAGEKDSDSEFELSLDGEGSSTSAADAPSDSDSEFELTLDEAGGLAPMDEEGSTEERDIFETDFEVPALDEESGSQAVALDEGDTDLESSDFDLALGEEDIAGEEDSHSQVVAIEEEDDEVAPVTKTRRRRPLDDEDEDVRDEDEDRPGRPAAAVAAPAPWGVMPAVVMFPCVLVMFLAGLMAFELVHIMWGYHQPSKVSGLIIRPMAEMFTDELPKQ